MNVSHLGVATYLFTVADSRSTGPPPEKKGLRDCERKMAITSRENVGCGGEFAGVFGRGGANFVPSQITRWSARSRAPEAGGGGSAWRIARSSFLANVFRIVLFLRLASHLRCSFRGKSVTDACSPALTHKKKAAARDRAHHEGAVEQLRARLKASG